MKKKFDVTGMSCAACSAHVERAVRLVPGVTEVAVSLLTNSMTVDFSLPASAEAISDAVSKAGYSAVLHEDTPASVSPGRDGKITNSFDKEAKEILLRLLRSLVLFLPLLYCSMGIGMWNLPSPAVLRNVSVNALVQMVLALSVMILNRRFFVSGVKGVLSGGANMDTLVSLGSGVSFLYSTVLLVKYLLAGSGASSGSVTEPEFYFESAAMILVLISVGKMLEAYSKGRSTSAIDSLTRLAPREVRLLRNGTEILVPIEEVRTGDTVIVKPGESIPVDGLVIGGESLVDESALTGESDPIAKGPGSVVHTPTINGRGTLTVRATSVGSETTLSRIIRMVEDAASSKAPMQKMADRVAGIFVPAVILVSLVTFVIWTLVLRKNPELAGNATLLSFALERAISVLVISCPCSLGLATPVAIMVGSGVGARNGILFKNATSLEMTGKAEIVVLDKTGTITEGTVRDQNNRTEADFLKVRDKVRGDSLSAVRELKNLGLTVKMLTGDRKETALLIAREVGISEEDIISEVLPDGKDEAIRKVKEETGKRVLMVGDGINDGPALKRADVGIAIGAGTDVAIDAADIVLMKSNLTDLVSAIRLSQKTIRTIRENLFWAFLYNTVCIPLAAGILYPSMGIRLTPMMGAAAMSLSSVTVVLNALRINLFKPTESREKINTLCGITGKDDDVPPAEDNNSGKDNDVSPAEANNPGEDGIAPLAEANNSGKDDDVPPVKDKNSEKDFRNESEQEESALSRGDEKEGKAVNKMQKELHVEGMMCVHCKARVEDALKNVKGVTSAVVDLEGKSAKVELSEPVPDASLTDAVKAVGYEAEIIAG